MKKTLVCALLSAMSFSVLADTFFEVKYNNEPADYFVVSTKNLYQDVPAHGAYVTKDFSKGYNGYDLFLIEIKPDSYRFKLTELRQKQLHVEGQGNILNVPGTEMTNTSGSVEIPSGQSKVFGFDKDKNPIFTIKHIEQLPEDHKK